MSGIGHEINNPNTFIRGNLFIVQEAMNDIFSDPRRTPRDAPGAERSRASITRFSDENIPILIDDMVEGANRIKGIVDGLRKFGKRDEGFLNEIVDLNFDNGELPQARGQPDQADCGREVDLDDDLPAIMGNSRNCSR